MNDPHDLADAAIHELTMALGEPHRFARKLALQFIGRIVEIEAMAEEAGTDLQDIQKAVRDLRQEWRTHNRTGYFGSSVRASSIGTAIDHYLAEVESLAFAS